MIELLSEARELQAFCESKGWRFCFIGGLAVLRWGEPRFTADIDMTLMTCFGDEEGYVDALTGRYRARLSGMRDFALKNRVLLLESAEGCPIDIALGALPFEEEMVRRSTMFEFDQGMSLRTCSAEDLVVAKAFAGRDRDWADVEGIAVRQQGLDWDYIFMQIEPLAVVRGAESVMDRLRAARERAQGE